MSGEPWPTCDYHHDTEPDVRPAAWCYIGESGDYYVCEEHFAMRTPEGKRNWHRMTPCPGRGCTSERMRMP
jgi:hypothetical protein